MFFYKKLAEGGNTINGEIHLVGEEGPELLIPNGREGFRVIPAPETAILLKNQKVKPHADGGEIRFFDDMVARPGKTFLGDREIKINPHAIPDKDLKVSDDLLDDPVKHPIESAIRKVIPHKEGGIINSSYVADVFKYANLVKDSENIEIKRKRRK